MRELSLVEVKAVSGGVSVIDVVSAANHMNRTISTAYNFVKPVVENTLTGISGASGVSLANDGKLIPSGTSAAGGAIAGATTGAVEIATRGMKYGLSGAPGKVLAAFLGGLVGASAERIID